MTGRFIGKTYKEYQSKFIENFQYGKQIDDFLDMQKRQKTSTGPKTDFIGSGIWKIWKPGSKFWKFEKYIKDAPKKTVQNGSSTFANELMRFPNEAKPIWVEIQKHCKNAVTI